MEEPREDGMADDEERAPDFDALTSPDELVRGERTRDDFFDAVLALDTPATVDEVADLAGHGADAAREYLRWFERMGIVARVNDSPATYERNEEYLQWRRVQRLRKQYSTDELLELLQEETERDQLYADEFDAESPEVVSISAYASDTGRSVEDVWEAISMWKTTRRRITLLERALTRSSDGSTGQRTAV